MLFLFGNSELIILFSMALMWHVEDASQLYALLGIGVADVFAFAIYALKEAKANSAGGITFEAAKAKNFELDREHEE